MINSQNLANIFLNIQSTICEALSNVDGSSTFHVDQWQNGNNHGRTNVLTEGAVFEKAGVNFSHVKGDTMPASATAHRPELAGSSFEAMGVSLVVHPENPYIPTCHANVRVFIAYPKDADPIWWFGGGFDLTPYYPDEKAAIHWHQTAHDLCEPFGEDVYPRYKKWCDDYFYLPHRQESRGIGGLFFDDLNEWDLETCTAFIQAIANGFLEAYLPIVTQNKHKPYTDRERQFQLYRRGRYVEFNLVWDRGTLFGLQSGGRIESILMSMPPLVRFEYQFTPEKNSPEAELEAFLKPKDWLHSAQA